MSMDINLSTITLDLGLGWRDRWVVRWEDMDGNRFTYQTKCGTLDSKFGYIDKDPPKTARGMAYFSTRRLDVTTAASKARIAVVREHLAKHQMVEKAQAELRAKQVARIEEGREHGTRYAKTRRGVELYNHLRQLVAAQRRATTQHALDGLCDEAEGLLAQIDAEIAEINAEADRNIASALTI